MLHTYFMAGTDTDCGKTYVTVSLLDYLHRQSLSARALKPVASGCIEVQGVRVNEDVQRLEAANGTTSSPICHWMLPTPIAPHLAAKAAGVSISAAKIKAFCDAYPKEDLEYLLIEGAGGLLVPLNGQETWIDFLVQTYTPVILVVGMRLGCINHALLTAYALMKQHILCHGWIANFLDPDMLAQAGNLETLERWLDYPLLGTVPYQGTFCPHSKFV